jgi:AcrR family transcriptional regulator
MTAEIAKTAKVRAKTRSSAQDAPAASGLSARQRLLAAAHELFYEEGVHSVGIDRVIEKAGVAKASLYSTFGSKEALVQAYLEGRQETRKARIDGKVAAAATPRARLLAVFDALAERAAEPNFRGCPFVLATAEGQPGAGVRRVCDQSRGWLRDLFTALAAEAGAADPTALAQQLLLLYDGATIGSYMDADPKAPSSARALAGTLIDAAVVERPPRER